MIGRHSFGSCLPTFGNCVDRYCTSGYGGGGGTMDEMLDLARTVDGLDGLELVGNWHVNDGNIKEVAQKFRDRGLKIPMLVPDLWTQAKWGKGSLAAPDAATRRAAVDEIRKVLDWAAALDCPYIDVWPGQDGFDYAFTTDYAETWKWLGDGLAAVADYSPTVKVLVEYKPREPRNHCFVDHFGTALLLVNQFANVGVLLDVGHALQGAENIAHAAAILAHYGKLDYIHLNDNHGDWDDDLMVGGVHTVAFLEFFHWLRRLDYRGWLTLDIFPYREDGVRAAEACRSFIAGAMKAVERMAPEVDAAIAAADAPRASLLVQRALGLA